MIDQRIQEYWDSVRSQIPIDVANGRFTDNFMKRKELVRALLKFDLRDKAILEIGPGLGFTAAILNMLNAPTNYVGLDISPAFAKTAEELFGFKIHVGDAAEMPFSDGVFNTIFAFDVFEHTKPEMRPKIYKEISRVLRPEERVIFINNPLSKSRHESEFDFGWRENDVAELAAATKTMIVDVEILRIGNGCAYQFIALSSVRNRA